MLCVDQRHELGEHHASHADQVTLPLQHAGKASEVGLQPVLLGVAVRREAKVINHRVDVVFELGHFAAGFHLNGTGKVALGDGGGDFGDRAHLVGEVIGQQVDVAGQVLPRSGGAGDIGLTAEAAFNADFAGDRGDLIGESRQRVRHVVDRFGERGNFALRVDRELLCSARRWPRR